MFRDLRRGIASSAVYSAILVRQSQHCQQSCASANTKWQSSGCRLQDKYTSFNADFFSCDDTTNFDDTNFDDTNIDDTNVDDTNIDDTNTAAITSFAYTSEHIRCCISSDIDATTGFYRSGVKYGSICHTGSKHHISCF